MTNDHEKPASVLVVDDSNVMLRTAQKILSAQFTVFTAGDGEDAWNCLNRNDDIQVVFADLDMPHCTGFELLTRVRNSANPDLRDLPLIIVTGTEDDEAARQRALDLGATDFITKPFTSIDLLARARAHSEHRRMTRILLACSGVDPLTGLTNETGFAERLQQDISYARRHQQTISMMRVEIVDLQATVLNHGQDAADQAAQHVSNLIRGRIRKEDTAGYLGAGCFAISLPGGQADGVESIAAFLQAELTKCPPLYDGVIIAIKLGVAVVSAELHHWSCAQEALDQCQVLLDSGTPLPPQAEATALEPQDSPTPMPPPHELTFPPSPISPVRMRDSDAYEVGALQPLRIDLLIEQVREGQTQEAIDRMPDILERLLPLLQLQTADQRTQLVHLLEELSGS